MRDESYLTLRTALLALSLFSSFFLRPLAADDPVAPVSALKCTVLAVHDADTIAAVIECPLLKVKSQTVMIRAFGYDAWEVNRVRQTVVVTDEEIAKGKAARDELIALLQTAELWAEDSGSPDPYGRTSAVLWVKQTGGWIFLAKYADEHGWLRTPRHAERKP
jgi:endonuclease YncB( thermonuclease family)